jgi:hypothetical protein
MGIKLPAGMKNVQQHDEMVRVRIPDEIGQSCAPCSLESNLCCGGKFTVHYWHNDNFLRPAVPWLRTRISGEEWFAFVRALDSANLMGTVPCAPCVVFPCSFPLLLCQPMWFCIPFQYLEKKKIERENEFALAIAKFNRYLFMPRGIVARRQCELYKKPNGDMEFYYFLRLDFVPPGDPVDPYSLPPGLAPGTMKFDMQPISFTEWLDRAYYPCRSRRFTQMIPSPRQYNRGDEPEIEDLELAERFAYRNREIISGAVQPESMLRA